MGYIRTYANLRLCSLDQQHHEMTCGYWYTVTDGAMSHTAFRRRESLVQWLALVGLKPTADIPEPGQISFQRLEGTYRTEAHLDDAAVFYTLDGARSRTLSNGDYVDAIVTTDADLIRTVHTLNPNVRDRKVWDYRESEQLVG
jgi:hypothetical protein